MKVPPKRKGNTSSMAAPSPCPQSLNESPSQKEGKSSSPKLATHARQPSLNESPSKKDGKLLRSSGPLCACARSRLNKRLSEKEGKLTDVASKPQTVDASMKALPKRKGNSLRRLFSQSISSPLNESPSEKEGKCQPTGPAACHERPLNESPSEKEGKFLPKLPNTLNAAAPQ